MNIVNTYRNILHYLNLGPAVEEPKAEQEAQKAEAPANDSVEISDVADSDGPGAGGGYDDADDVSDSDGPGAGGGYDSLTSEKASEAEKPDESDGPGAGGGYDDDADDVGDSDGPGAGGGYDSLTDNDGPGAGGGYFYDEHSITGQATGHLFKSWTSQGQEWFIAPKAANSNVPPAEKSEPPAKKPEEGESK